MEKAVAVFRPLNISNRHIFKKLNPENGLNTRFSTNN
jgi:hypothetical protein